MTDHLGSVISESLGICEMDTSPALRDQLQSMEVQAQAQGMSHFVATGDSGAYECGQAEYPAASFPRPLTGSGYLVPAVDGHPVKAVTYSSVKWPHVRAADPAMVVVRCSVSQAAMASWIAVKIGLRGITAST